VGWDDSELVEVPLENTWHHIDGDWDLTPDGTQFSFRGHQEDSGGENRSRDALCVSDVRIADGMLQAQVMVEEVVPRGTCAQLMFRYQEPQTYLMAGLGGWEYEFSVGESRAPSPTLGNTRWRAFQGYGSISQIKPNQWYDIAVRFRDRQVDLYHGKVPVVEVNLPREYTHWKPGNVGLMGFGLWKARFRNVRAWQLVAKTDISPRLQQLDLKVVRDPKLRAVAQKDLYELRSIDSTAAPKATVLLCGSIAESALLDYLARNEAKAKAAAAGLPQPVTSAIKRWRFETMIEVARLLGGIGNQTYATSHVLRNWRNWVHPGRPEAQTLEPTPVQAVTAAECMLALFADLK